MPIIRRWFVTDRDGVEVEITSKEVLQAIIDQMTPEEFERWKIQYRFVHVEFDEGFNRFQTYYGTLRDLN